jgi:Xaa-Pro aminopeptidase
MTGSIPQKIYKQRRQKVLDEIGNGVALLPVGNASGSMQGEWQPEWDFYYLTGIADEPGAYLLLEGGEKKESILLLKPLNPEVEEWDGYRLKIGSELKKVTGIEKIHRVGALSGILTQAARRTKRLVCLLPFAGYKSPVSADLEIFKKVAERAPGVKIEDGTDILPQMRRIKDEYEIALLRQAVDITMQSIMDAISTIKPGVSEFELQENIEHGYKTRGSRQVAFDTIAGSGLNTTVLHYKSNHNIMKDGDLVVLDTGARYKRYNADITRTYPINGKFSEEQAGIYQTVLDCQKKVIAAAAPGVTLEELNKISKDFMEEAGYADYYIHGIGHYLGGEVHDVGQRERTLEAGSVITVEPGIYIAEKQLGVRIEDDVLITAKGCEVLSEKLPKEISEVEALMAAK